MPRQFHENVPIEILYTVIPVIIVGFLFVFTVLTENNVDAIQPVNATAHLHGKAGGRHDGDRLPVGLAVRLPEQRRGGRRDHRTAPATTARRWSSRWARPCRSPWCRMT